MTDQQYQIYLAVPGKHFCWGTTTGVVNSTRNHIVRPFNGGLGFSGVVDFNWCWVDAMNLLESGEITHFAMLHGDIEPDPTQRWIDILLEEMEAHSATLVSTHLPIKDQRGLTSSGVCDPAVKWGGAYRRFTQKEILHELPETFNNVLAGYPDKPLLHNTGCWIADLRKPVFRELNTDGSLKTFFQFPERIVRDKKGKWSHEQESEDWYFSRDLWERGVRDTWITRRVRLTHFGMMGWPNWVDFGDYENGDENTAWLWRADAENLPLSLVQLLEFELGSKCNLGHEHTACPNLHPERYGTLDTSWELDDETIVSCVVRAYNELGFTGLIGWIYYNEPLLQADRMFALMAQIKESAPRARFILWTNGMLIPEECEQYRQFSEIVVSGYNEQSRRGVARLFTKRIDAKLIDDARLDDRRQLLTITEDDRPCLRPHVELIVDNYGNTHICCYDWQGKGTFGNVHAKDFGQIAEEWRASLPSIAGQTMASCAPDVCRTCSHKWDRYQQHDERIVAWARKWRERLAQSPPVAEPQCSAAATIMDESGCAIGEAAALIYG